MIILKLIDDINDVLLTYKIMQLMKTRNDFILRFDQSLKAIHLKSL